MATEKLHVAMFPWFAFGHFIPYLHLSNKLAERGAETASDVPFSLYQLLASALDKTEYQVETILTNLKPDIVFFDFGRWIPSITRQLGTKSIYYSVINACILAFFAVPGRRFTPEITLEEKIQLPPGYPSTTRLTSSLKVSDAIVLRSCQDTEGPYSDYLGQQYSKPVLLTGPILPETSATKLEEKWGKSLNKFEPGSVVYCAFGSQITLQKEQFEEIMLGFELSGFPFLVALTPPHGCPTIEEALPEGLKERIGERGWVHGGWVLQTLLLKHPSIGCFVSHCGFGSMWESLVSDCQIVLIPFLPDQVMGTRLMAEELKV
ncbi:hypothetical protein Patl1_04751 [Pistacia atlantica]|uniref:Uncharacterized protein n=1 Tax=Pistacia atlantica TaxID=434234 RepID=A0ACC1BQG8_9ROSI|nr:hypothetical protein Patl1_04751 [Pistacia atlantica]